MSRSDEPGEVPVVEQRGRADAVPSPSEEESTVRMPPTGPQPTVTATPTPTVATTVTPPSNPATAPQPVVATKRSRWPLVLTGVLLLVLGTAGGWFARGTLVSEPVPVAAPVATTAPTPTATTVPPLPVAGPPIIPSTTPNASDGPALGRTTAGSRGWGVAQPTEIDGDDGAVVVGVRWEDWGEDRATGTGTAPYTPDDDGEGGDTRVTQERATVVAFDLGDCDGREAYRRVTWYFPQHDEEFSPSRSVRVCD
ncbi:hypothetical protein [Actinomycetospora termitidis]|uniref:Serine/threonine protein kinase n=1 Tax=Actinomycetospora termitidis TaxID=3053470 RepID=A0ABT7MFY6_9PSEU|nr:hypothetical protein [Actinomycetospora sp. Odt1-22]MDL5159593.1 hypothetical protein [Actinomycetospora sp. Odt1-22]